jgi:signal transduction histidine kinase
MRRRRLKGLFIAGSALTVAALLAVALVALRAMIASHASTSQAASAELAGLRDAGGLQGLLYQKGFVAEYFLTGDERWVEELKSTQPAVDKWLATLTREAVSPRAAAAVAQLVAEYGRYDADRARALQQFKSGDRAAALSTHVGFTARLGHLRELADALIEVRRAEVTEQLQQAERDWEHALAALAAAIALAVVGAAVIGWVLARRVARPLYDLVLRAEHAAGGERVDVTADDEIGALDEHVSRLARRVMQAEKMSALGEMATAMAHEVLNPLTGVKTAVQLLARGKPGDADVVETAAAVDAEIRRVEGIARRLMSFSRPLAPQQRRIPLGELVERVDQATRQERDKNRVELSWHKDGVEAVVVDPELMLQLLINLVTNATQAMPSGGTVQLAAARVDGWVRLGVRDDGPGIAPEILPRLFTPFATTRPDGHGLGLALAQNIAVAHGGRIEAVSNTPSRGATFTVWLPA